MFPRVLAFLLLLLGLVACTDNRSPPPADAGEREGAGSYADVVTRTAPSAVTVRVEDGVGSGVVLRSDVVVTNEHVVKTNRQVRIRYADGQESGGEVLATDPLSDLAVIRTERKNLPVAEFSTELPRPGVRCSTRPDASSGSTSPTSRRRRARCRWGSRFRPA